ncbi:hypothetical protein [Hyphomonas johnsonii]|jgi:hypothetical protein|uniref:Uncharacterized protein n=1 Tax=Hyphomonas johnsonii MHS-2 TaxID=1280950 RepID=A0A059FPK2_9PROT|nr:hypothetical protein [Hyphomonas johnsonii]KCZ92408.1 hypothetical protein HJO_10244 [Hyphomonas johnsonii MHS-2]
MSEQNLTDDLAYLRDMAEAGQNAPLLGGRFLSWWGGLGALAYLGHYAIAEGFMGLQPVAFAWLWGGYAILGFGGFRLLQMTFPAGKPGAASMGNKVSRLVWMGAGMTLFAYFAGALARSFADGHASAAFVWSLPVVFSVYGLSQLTTGLIAGNRFLTLAGWGAIASVAAAVFLLGSNLVWVFGAVVAGLTVFLPGVLMMRSEPSDTV